MPSSFAKASALLLALGAADALLAADADGPVDALPDGALERLAALPLGAADAADDPPALDDPPADDGLVAGALADPQPANNASITANELALRNIRCSSNLI